MHLVSCQQSLGFHEAVFRHTYRQDPEQRLDEVKPLGAEGQSQGLEQLGACRLLLEATSRLHSNDAAIGRRRASARMTAVIKPTSLGARMGRATTENAERDIERCRETNP
jgi:hypothetical protein